MFSLGCEGLGIITSPCFSVQVIAENKIGESGNCGFVLFGLGFWIATTFDAYGRGRTSRRGKMFLPRNPEHGVRQAKSASSALPQSPHSALHAL